MAKKTVRPSLAVLTSQPNSGQIFGLVEFIEDNAAHSIHDWEVLINGRIQLNFSAQICALDWRGRSIRSCSTSDATGHVTACCGVHPGFRRGALELKREPVRTVAARA